MNKPVVVGVDGSKASFDAVRWATEEARTREVPLRLVHAELPLPGEALDPDGRTRKALHDQAWQWLHEAADVAREVHPDVRLDVHLEVAAPAPLLVAESVDAGLVVLGSRGLGGFTSMLLGSTAIAVTSRGGCPVAVVRGEARPGPVVCGVDGDNPTVLAHAFEQASARDASLVLVHTWHAPPEPLADMAGVDLSEQDAEHGGNLAAAVAPWRDKYPGVPLDLVIARGNPARTLLDRARDAALLVVGCRGRGALTGLLLGFTSHTLLHHAPCPVLVVRATVEDV
ncbi:nucleotide-binding universal stress UspA family protein [Saccharothrix saharensis]|uniref:Nucleotide-binding universal stress UspA family protein n=1 Tax=Saccharothrix saharensis TaxID=571190 RepID=A0A543J7V8_9PSEU|nr:universal stress protein [Saccharothrix saharensis]TQM78915.1 nucleotide-binding universal stress UspA family protein [Saccharothrix saharensis]